MVCRTKGAAGGEWSNCSLGADVGRGRHDDRAESRSLGGSSAEAVTNETGPTKEALERRTWRTHCRWPCNNPGVTVCCLPRSPLDVACV